MEVQSGYVLKDFGSSIVEQENKKLYYKVDGQVRGQVWGQKSRVKSKDQILDLRLGARIRE